MSGRNSRLCATLPAIAPALFKGGVCDDAGFRDQRFSSSPRRFSSEQSKTGRRHQALPALDLLSGAPKSRNNLFFEKGAA
jgi:hypothetical protein